MRIFVTIFFAVQALLFALYYYIFNYIDIFKNSFLLSFIALTPAIFLVGYILYNFLIEPKQRQDFVLEQLIRETLHEINLPISTIEANISMFSKNLNNKKELKRLDRIKQAIKRLKRLYLQLNYNIKKEIMPIEKEIVLLNNLVEDRVTFFKDLNRNDIILELEELKIKVDKIGLEQTIDNLIENAMKYSDADKPINIILKDTKLIIEDKGIGIEQDELSLIYQRYYQESQNSKGEGIGLTIVKSYCESQEILLKIESKKGIGTKVILDFKSVLKRVEYKQ